MVLVVKIAQIYIVKEYISVFHVNISCENKSDAVGIVNIYILPKMFTKNQKNYRTFVENLIAMWTFIILSFGLVFSLYNLKKSLQEKKHTKKKQTKRNTPRRNDRVFYDAVPDDEMTEEQMIAEDYYYYQDKE